RFSRDWSSDVCSSDLARLGEAMLPLFHPTPETAVTLATTVLDRFMSRFEHHWLDGMRAKLGLFDAQPDDDALVDDLLRWMHQSQIGRASGRERGRSSG